MAYRPYPNADRALRQLDRHGRTVPPRPLTEFEQQMEKLKLDLSRQATFALEAMADRMSRAFRIPA
jgi:hypothetical protein